MAVQQEQTHSYNPDKEESFSEFMSPSHMKSHELHYMHRYLNVIMKKRDHENKLKELSPNIHKGLLALKKLQLETMQITADFHRRVHVLEKEFLSKHEIIFGKRAEIINGDRIPSADECDVNDVIGGLSQTLSKVEINDETFKGIPDFWMTVLKVAPQLSHMVHDRDETVLKYLTDLRVHSETEPEFLFTLEFHFGPNEFFENRLLEKTYFIKCDPDACDPFGFDGPEIFKAKGTEIKWMEGKNITTEEVDGKLAKVESFFNFFAPPDLIEDPNHPLFHEVNAILEADFEIGFYLKDRVIPRAVLYYTGDTKDEEDQETDSEVSYLNVVYENTDDEKPNDEAK